MRKTSSSYSQVNVKGCEQSLSSILDARCSYSSVVNSNSL